VLVEPDYRRYRIEVNAAADRERWNADAIIRRTLSSDKPHHERVSCYADRRTCGMGRHAVGAAVDR
jgi:hypothetical protein